MDNHEYLDKKGLGQLLSNLKSKYIEKFSVNGKTVTYTRGDGTTGQFTTQDTTYSTATTDKDGLMSAEDKNKLSGIATGANKTVVDSSLSSTSTNPVQNKVVNSALADKVPVSRTVNGKALSANITLSASDVSADAKGTASSAVSSHNTSTSAHNDIRTLITTLTTRLNALADSDDTTLDQMSEIVDYIKSNRSLIESVTTSKVSVSDIVNNLTTNVTNKPLSAAQGVEIKKLIDALQTAVDGKAASGHKHAASDITSGTLSSDRLPVVPASKGGTGQTSLNNSANVLINALTTGDSTPTDADYYISQSVSGGTTTTTYHRRPMSALWAYIKGKTDTLYAKISHTHKISDISDLTATATELNYVDGVTSNVQTQLDTKAKASDLTSHTGNKSNPHGVTKAQIGLGNVENKSSEAIRSELTKANVTSALGYTPPTTNTTYGVATTSANGLMSSTDKKRVDSFAGSYNLGSMSGKTVADLQSALKTWLASYYNIANATCYFTGDSSWVTLWNAGDTTSTIPAGSMFTVRVAGFFGNGTYAQLEITSYYDKSVYYTALQNNSWQSVRKVAFDSDLSTKQNTITGGGSTITTSNLTANKALISNGSGKVAVSDVTSTELGYLDGVTSNVQTQLDGKSSSSHTHASAPKLTTARTISLGTGVTSTATSFDGSSNITIPVTGVKESYLAWGGRNLTYGYSPIDAAMIPALGADRFAYGNAAGITVEYSRDSGSTWTDYGLTDAQKVALFSPSEGNVLIGKADSSNKATAAYMLRITIDTDKFGVYTALNKFALHISTNGSSGSYCTIEASLESTPTSFTTFANKVSISGWSGWNIINTSAFTTYGNSSTSQYGLIRFTFGCTGGSTSYNGLLIYGIKGFGGMGWNTPSNLAKYGTIYSCDNSQNVTFPAMVTATSFKGSLNGNATSATKATQDGSGNVITNTYATKSDLIELIYPVGSIYISVKNTSPATFLGGTWESFGSGRTLIGVDANDSDFSTAEKTGGEKAHTLSSNEIPSHAHTVNSHTHSIPALSGSAASAGAHTHTITSSSSSAGAHTHTTSGTAASAGNHKHSVPHNADASTGGSKSRMIGYNSSGSTDAKYKNRYSDETGAHTHSVSGTAASAGAHTHTISSSSASAGAHTHTVTTTANTSGSASPATNSIGGNGAHNNLQPYVTVYMWKRTA